MADNQKFAQLQPFSLAGSGCTLGATSITLSSMYQIDGTTTVTITNFGDKGFGTLEPGNGTREEQISFTGITQNANGTATLTGVKTVAFIDPYTETSGTAMSHPGGAKFIISNTAGFYAELTSKENDETIDGIWSFTQVPNTLQDPVSGDDIARRSWVLTVVNGGAVSTDAVIVTGTAGETVAAGNLLYLSTSDGLWYKTDADTAATVDNIVLGIAQGAGTVGVSISGGVLLQGVDANQSGLVAGTIYYASNSAGGISSSAGTTEVTVGVGKSTTELYFYPRFNQQLTENQKDALAGNSGTPSATNRFITELGQVDFYGTGADGEGSITGGTTTLTRDMHYNNLTVSATGVLETAGFRVFVKKTFTKESGGIIRNNGGNGGDAAVEVAGTAGAVAPGGTVPAGLVGKVGATGRSTAGTGTAGTAGDSTAKGLGSAGVAGGAGGTVGGETGGAGGAAGSKTGTVYNNVLSFLDAYNLYDLVPAIASLTTSAGSGSGGAGGRNGSGTSGGGGGSGATGGMVWIAAQTMVINGTAEIQANGGNGGTGGNATGDSGGGGGGAGGTGGVIILIYNSISGTYTLSVAGGTAGTAGTGATNGANGTAGNAGVTFSVDNG